MRILLSIVALLIAPTGAGVVTPNGKAYADFQASHGDLDMCNPAKVAILMESLGLSATEANKFYEFGINGGMLRVIDADMLKEMGFSQAMKRTKITAWVREIDMIEKGEDSGESKRWAILVCLFFPPAAVFMLKGCSFICCVNCGLSTVWLPGFIHALYIIYNPAASIWGWGFLIPCVLFPVFFACCAMRVLAAADKNK